MNICDLLKENEENKKRKNEDKENNENEIIIKKPKIIESLSKQGNESNVLKDHNEKIDDDIILISEEKTPSKNNLQTKINKSEKKNVNLAKKDEYLVQKLIPFQNLLRTAKQAGNDSIGGEAKELANLPGLYVENYGDVPLPLNEVIAEGLIKLSTQAPYGYKYDTLYNKDVRDTFQIEPSAIKIKNPEWNEGLNKLTKRVAEGLGCHGKIEAKLYKMLIYKQGGHFKKHSDTEKEKNMFATLILQLPSIHEGNLNKI